MRLQLDKKIETHQKLDELLKDASIDIEKYKPAQREHARELLEINCEQLRRYLAAHPELWRQGQDMASAAIDYFIDRIQSPPAMRELFRARTLALQVDLGAGDASTLVRLLIDAVVLAYLQWILTSMQHANNVNGTHTAENAIYWDKRLASAQRQYLRACETLARVRKLSRGVPELQHDMSDGLVM